MPSAATIARRLAADSSFTSWKELPDDFPAQAAGLSDDGAINLVSRLWHLQSHRFLYAASQVVEHHPTAYRRIRWRVLEPLGDLMGHWGDVDAFVMLAGPAWRDGRITDARVLRWTRSPNRWWRRAALVCTVYLNRRSCGGQGDSPRTLAVCERLADDHDDMVAKGMSWALRSLLAHDRPAVERFLRRHEDELPALVKREVHHKLETGVKSPRRMRD